MSGITLTQRQYDTLMWQAGIDTKQIDVGDELILRVKVVQVQPATFSSNVRVCIEDGSGMLTPVVLHTIIAHFPMNSGPTNVMALASTPHADEQPLPDDGGRRS